MAQMQQTKQPHLRSVLEDVATKLEYLLPLPLPEFSDLDDKEICLLFVPSSISPPTMDMGVNRLSYPKTSLDFVFCLKVVQFFWLGACL